MVTNEGLRFPGDVDIERIEIFSANGAGVEVTDMVAEIQIFEDMFAPCVTGTLAITDSIDLVNKFPFVGEEKVLIQIKTPAMPDLNESVINQECISILNPDY